MSSDKVLDQETKKVSNELSHNHISQAHHELNKFSRQHPHEFNKLASNLKSKLGRELGVHRDKHGNVTHLDFHHHDIYNNKSMNSPSKHEQQHQKHASDGVNHTNKKHTTQETATQKANEKTNQDPETPYLPNESEGNKHKDGNGAITTKWKDGTTRTVNPDGSGKVTTSKTDENGNKTETSKTWDKNGNVTGDTATVTDANGNKTYEEKTVVNSDGTHTTTSKETKNGVVIDIQRQEDANAKLINSSETRTDASGNKIYQSQTTVDSNGNKTVRTIEQKDANKVYTTMQYNADGTINAKQTTYDANGNKVSETTDPDKIVQLNN